MYTARLGFIVAALAALSYGCSDDEGGAFPEVSCSDAVYNGDETDLDCGGSCAPCDDGETCEVSSDCVSRSCDENATCATPPSCDDEVQNGDETGIDCGGICGGVCITVVEDFEGDTSDWELLNSEIALNAAGSLALHIENKNDDVGCQAGFGRLESVHVPASATAILFDISGDVTDGGDPYGQMWFTLGAYLGLPTLPIGDARTDSFCVPADVRNTDVSLEFVIRSSGSCGPPAQYEAFIDNIAFSEDDTGCADLQVPI